MLAKKTKEIQEVVQAKETLEEKLNILLVSNKNISQQLNDREDSIVSFSLSSLTSMKQIVQSVTMTNEEIDGSTIIMHRALAKLNVRLEGMTSTLYSAFKRTCQKQIELKSRLRAKEEEIVLLKTMTESLIQRESERAETKELERGSTGTTPQSTPRKTIRVKGSVPWKAPLTDKE